MQVQVNTDDHVVGREDMERELEAQMRTALHRFAEQVTRVEMHLSDVKASKPGDDHKRCLIEARVAARQPVAVSHLAGTMREAVAGATDKLKRALDSSLGKLRHAKGGETIRGELQPED